MIEAIIIEAAFPNERRCHQFMIEHGYPREWLNGRCCVFNAALAHHSFFVRRAATLRRLKNGSTISPRQQLGATLNTILSAGENGFCEISIEAGGQRLPLDRSTIFAIKRWRDPGDSLARLLSTMLLLATDPPPRITRAGWMSEHLVTARRLIEGWQLPRRLHAVK